MSTIQTAKPLSNSAVLIACYMVLLGILMLCGGITLTIIVANGSFGELIGSGADASTVRMAGNVLALIGIGAVVLAVGSLAVAVGIFNHKSWSYYGILVVNSTFAGVEILGWLMNPGAGDCVSLLLIVASAACVRSALTDESLKAALKP